MLLKLKNFYFAKVLPLVYNDTLTFVELINKFVKKINETIENVNSNSSAIQAIQSVLNSWILDLTELEGKLAELQAKCVESVNGKTVTEGTNNIELGAVDIPNTAIEGLVSTNVQSSIAELLSLIQPSGSSSLFGYVDAYLSSTSGVVSYVNRQAVYPSTISTGATVIGSTGNIGRITAMSELTATVTSLGVSVTNADMLFCNGDVPTVSGTAIENVNYALYPQRGIQYRDGSVVLGTNGAIATLTNYTGNNYTITGTGAALPTPENYVGFSDVTSGLYAAYPAPTLANILTYVGSLTVGKYYVKTTADAENQIEDIEYFFLYNSPMMYFTINSNTGRLTLSTTDSATPTTRGGVLIIEPNLLRFTPESPNSYVEIQSDSSVLAVNNTASAKLDSSGAIVLTRGTESVTYTPNKIQMYELHTKYDIQITNGAIDVTLSD